MSRGTSGGSPRGPGARRKVRRVALSLAVLVAMVAAAGAGLRSFTHRRASALPPGATLMGTDDVVFQRSERDCGAAVLVLLGHRLGVAIPYDRLAREVPPGRGGLSFQALSDLAAPYGIRLDGYRFGRATPLPRPP